MLKWCIGILMFFLCSFNILGSGGEEHEKKQASLKSSLPSYVNRSGVVGSAQVPLHSLVYNVVQKTYDDSPKSFASAVAGMRVGLSFLSTFLFRKTLSQQLGTDKLNDEKTKARVQAMPFRERWIARNPGLWVRGFASFVDNLSISSIYSYFDTVNHPAQAAVFLSAQSWVTVPFSFIVQARTYSVDLWRSGKISAPRSYKDIFLKDYRYFYRGGVAKAMGDSISWFTFFKIDASYKCQQKNKGFSWQRYGGYVTLCAMWDTTYLLPLSNIRAYIQQNPMERISLLRAGVWIYENREGKGFFRGWRPFLATSFLWNALDLGYLSLMQSLKGFVHAPLELH